MIKLVTPIDQLDSSAQYTVGDRTITSDGNEYIYVNGIASCAQYDWVYYVNPTGSITRLVANAKGHVGIAQSAIVTNKCGWVGVKGLFVGKIGGLTGAGGTLYVSGTTATVTGGITSGDLVARAFSVAAVASGTTTHSLNYPFVSDTLS